MIKKYWHVLLLVAMSLIPLVWFWGRGDVLINGVDTNFPLNPKLWLIRRFFMWNNLSNGGSDFSFAPAGIFFHIIQFIPYIIGLSLQLTEKISMIFWFGLIVLNSYVFAGNFIKGNRLLKVLFVTLYALNIYMFNTWENVKVANLSLVAGIPLLLHIFINLKDNLITKSKALLLLVAVSFILSGAGINPAYFITAIITLFVFAFTTVAIEGKFKEVSKAFLSMIVVIAVISSYWLIPTISFVTRTVSQSSSIGSIGFNNWINSLSENTSIINVLRLQGAWDWYSFDGVSKAPLYLPYTPNYFFRTSFIIFSFIIPLITLLSLTFIDNDTNKRKYYLSFLLMFLLGVFLGTGSHEPTGIVFKLLVEYLPYFSLFRSPWYIFTPILTLSLSGLTVLFFERFKKTRQNNFVVLLLIVVNFIYCYPLITGRIFRPTKPDGFFINFPQYIFDIGSSLPKLTENRVITYPDDQLEKFNWGYIGVEPVINLFTNSEMIFPAINNTMSASAQIASEFYSKMKINNIEAVKNILSKLNVDIILEKTDQQTLAPKLSGESFDTFQKENWILHKVNKNSFKDNKVILANNFYYNNSFNISDAVGQLGFVGKDAHLINSNDNVIDKISYFLNNSGQIVVSSNLQNNNFNKSATKNIDLTKVEFEFDVPEDGYYAPILERYGMENNELENVKFLNENISIFPKLIRTDDSYAYFDKMFIKAGRYIYTYSIFNPIVFKEEFDSKGGQLSLMNSSEDDLKYKIKLPNFNPNKKYFITFDYNWGKGNKPLVLIEQRKDKTLFKLDEIGLEGETAISTYKTYYSPVQTKSEVFITFVAPKTESSRGTLVNYDNLFVTELFTNKLYFVKESKVADKLADIEFIQKSPVKYEGVVKNVNNPQTLIFAENYSDGWKIKITDMNGNKIRYRADHFTIDLYANAWYIDTLNQDFKFEIYYDPQKYFNLGVFISTLSIMVILVIYTINKFKK